MQKKKIRGSWIHGLFVIMALLFAFSGSAEADEFCGASVCPYGATATYETIVRCNRNTDLGICTQDIESRSAACFSWYDDNNDPRCTLDDGLGVDQGKCKANYAGQILLSCERLVNISYVGCCSGGGGGGCGADEECRTEQTCPDSRQGNSCGVTAGGDPKVCCAPAPGGGGGGSCTLTLTPASTTVSVGNSVPFTASVNQSYQNDYVQFLSSNVSIATVSPGTDPDTTFSTQATGVSSGSVTITANARVTGSQNIFCSDTSSLTVGGSASCTVDLIPTSTQVSIGAATIFTASVTPSGGTVERVDFSLSNPARANLDPTSDSVPAYTTEAAGQSVGTTSVIADVYMAGALTCSDTSALTVIQPGAWWQLMDADILTLGNLISRVPASLGEGFILDGAGGFPGVAVYGGDTADFEAGAGTGTVSSTGWLANASSIFSKTFSFNYFESLVPADIIFNEITNTSVPGSTFASGGIESRGYFWYLFDGTTGSTLNQDLTIASDADLGSRRVILMVKGADLNIAGGINLDDGAGFFAAFTGKNESGAKGSIFVDPSTGSGFGPDLEGFYFADGEFHTGAGDEQLYVRGSVAAYDGVSLERDLPDNSSTPAEFFEYALDQAILYPPSLSVKKIRWKEVAP